MLFVGSVPDDWKSAIITPVFKQEAQLMLTNPRDAFSGQSRSLNIVPFNSNVVFKSSYNGRTHELLLLAISLCNEIVQQSTVYPVVFMDGMTHSPLNKKLSYR